MNTAQTSSRPREEIAPRPRNWPVIIGFPVAVLLIAALIFFAVKRNDAPRLNADTISLVRYIGTNEYARLPFERKALYMKVIEDREDNGELKTAFNSGKISESEYRLAIMEAWLGQQLKRSEKFASLPPGPARTRYLNDLIDKKQDKTAPARPIKPQVPTPADDIKRDGSLEKVRIEEWPAEARLRWNEFNKAFGEQKDIREAAAADAASKSQSKSQ